MIFDFHVHCFPDALAPRAMRSLAETSAIFDVYPHTDGTVADTVSKLRHAGISGAHVLSVATNARQVSNVNAFAVSQPSLSSGFFVPAGAIHPDCESPENVIDALFAAGVRGIKVHPDYVGVMIDDARYDRIFTACEERGMYVVTHAGADPVSPDKIHCTPEGMLRVVRAHPGLTFIAAHMGGNRQLAGVMRDLCGTAIYFDTSLSSIRPDEREGLIGLIKEHGYDKFFFGTDTPWSDPVSEISFIANSGLPQNAVDCIFYKNAARLLKLGQEV